MTLQSYTPYVTCDNPQAKPTQMGPMQSAQKVLDQMQTSTLTQVFGKAGDGNVEVALPMSIAAGDRRKSFTHVYSIVSSRRD